jgi:hypothetical protein
MATSHGFAVSIEDGPNRPGQVTQLRTSPSAASARHSSPRMVKCGHRLERTSSIDRSTSWPKTGIKQEMTHAEEIHRIPNGRWNSLPASRSRPVRDLDLLGARSAHGTEGPEIGTETTLVPQSAIIALLRAFRLRASPFSALACGKDRRNGKRKASKGEIHSVAVVLHTRNGIGEKDMPAKGHAA